MHKSARLTIKFIFCTLALTNYIHAADILGLQMPTIMEMPDHKEHLKAVAHTSHEQKNEGIFALCSQVQEICEPYLKDNKDYNLHKKDLESKNATSGTAFSFLSNVCYQLAINEEVDSSILKQVVMTDIPARSVCEAFVAVRCHHKGQLLTSKALFLQEIQARNNKEHLVILAGTWVDRWAERAQETDSIYQESFTGSSVPLAYYARLGEEWRNSNGYFSPEDFLRKLTNSSRAFVFTHIEKEQIQRTASVWISAFLQPAVRKRLAFLLKGCIRSPETVFLQELADTAASIVLPIAVQPSQTSRSPREEALTACIRSVTITPLPNQRTFEKLAHAIFHPEQVDFDDDDDDDGEKKLKKDQEEIQLQTSGKSEKELEKLRKLQLKTQQIQLIKKIFKAYFRSTTTPGYEAIYKGWEKARLLPEYLEEDPTYQASKKLIDNLWKTFDEVQTYVSPTQWKSVVHHLKKVPPFSQFSETQEKELFAYKNSQDARPPEHAVQTKRDYYKSHYGDSVILPNDQRKLL